MPSPFQFAAIQSAANIKTVKPSSLRNAVHSVHRVHFVPALWPWTVDVILPKVVINFNYIPLFDFFPIFVVNHKTKT